jgi:hypothetical protein
MKAATPFLSAASYDDIKIKIRKTVVFEPTTARPPLNTQCFLSDTEEHHSLCTAYKLVTDFASHFLPFVQSSAEYKSTGGRRTELNSSGVR